MELRFHGRLTKAEVISMRMSGSKIRALLWGLAMFWLSLIATVLATTTYNMLKLHAAPSWRVLLTSHLAIFCLGATVFFALCILIVVESVHFRAKAGDEAGCTVELNPDAVVVADGSGRFAIHVSRLRFRQTRIGLVMLNRAGKPLLMLPYRVMTAEQFASIKSLYRLRG